MQSGPRSATKGGCERTSRSGLKASIARTSAGFSTSAQWSDWARPPSRALCRAGSHVSKEPRVGSPDRSTPTTPCARYSSASATVSSAASEAAVYENGRQRGTSQGARSDRVPCGGRGGGWLLRTLAAIDREEKPHSDAALTIAATRPAARGVDACRSDRVHLSPTVACRQRCSQLPVNPRTFQH